MTALREHYERHFLIYELVASIAIVGAATVFIEVAWGREELFEVLDGGRQALYVAIASIAGSLLGFTVATVSIILAFAETPRLRFQDVLDGCERARIFAARV